MTKMRTVDAAVAILEKEGATEAFGLPGAAINPFYSAMRNHGGIRHTLARHVEGASHMADKGFVKGWGLGRHVLGSNFFHYVRDPWGSYAEYSSDIDYVPVDHDWEAKDHPPEDSFYVWGPTPPEEFAVNHEIVNA